MSKKPVIFYAGNTVVKGGHVVGVHGEYLDSVRQAFLSDGEAEVEVALRQQNRHSMKFQIPDSFAPGAYTLRLSGDECLTHIVNAPVVRWIQGDEGASATENGWLRVQGECLYIADERPLQLLLTDARGVHTALSPSRVYDEYSVKFDLHGIPEGRYQARYSNGYGECDGGDVLVAPSPEAAWGKTVYNVTEYGLSNESWEDCSPALGELLKKAGAEGGGVLYFPRGRYHLTAPFVIPRGVVLRGDGYRYTQLFWTDEWRGQALNENESGNCWMPTKLPEVMVLGEGDFAIEDLEFAAGRIGRLLKAGDKERPANNVRLDRVRVNVNAMWDMNGRHHQNTYIAVLKETWRMHGQEHHMLNIGGDNIKIRDCDFNWSGCMCAFGNNLSNLLIQKTRFGNVNSVRHWMPLGDMDGAIIEDCDICNWDVGFGGDRAYMARCGIHDTTCGDRESFTSDITAGIPYGGKARMENEITFLFPEEADMKKATPGMKLCVLKGTGMGQYRVVKRVEGHRVVVDSPFAVAPDEESCLTVSSLFCYWYMKDITVDNAGAFQFYAAQGFSVVDGLKITRSAGIHTWGDKLYGGFSHMWYMSLIRCHLSEGNYFHQHGWYENRGTRHRKPVLPGYSFMTLLGAQLENMCVGFAVRDNEFRDDCLLFVDNRIDGGVADLIIDSNHFEDSRCGIVIHNHPKRTLLSNNTSLRVKELIREDVYE